jgi:hypothetical protein
VNSSSKLLVSALPFYDHPKCQSMKLMKGSYRRGTYDSREVRRRDPLVQHIIPTNILEEGLAFNLFGILPARTQATVRIPCEQLQQQIARRIQMISTNKG